MKFQFQFAGVNLDRPVPQNQRRKRWVIFGVSLALIGVCYWQYLGYLSHGSFFFMQIRKPVPAATAKPVPARTITPPVTAPAEEKMPTTMKLAAESTIVAAATAVADVVKLPAVPVSQTEAASAPAETMTVVSVVSPAKSKTHRPKTPETPEQRLQRAGKLAMSHMLDQANKYPDAYGFTANDVFTETTMGDPIPVYTVAEKDRASYQAGQPVEKILKPANQWVFPVFAGARLCCMVEVTYNGHEYIPGNASKFLAMAWTKIADRWPVSEGYHPRLIVNPDFPGYYFTIPEHPMPNVTDTSQMFYLHPSLSPADVILASWR